MRYFAIFLFALSLLTSCSSFQKFDYSGIQSHRRYALEKVQLDSIVSVIERYHPDPYGAFNEEQISIFIDSLVAVHYGDSLTYWDWNLHVKKMISLFNGNDPHIIFSPTLIAPPGYRGSVNRIKVLPFSVLQVNDTLIVANSHNELLKKGDRIISINEIETQTLLQYQSQDKWRHYDAFYLQLHYPLLFSENFTVKIERQAEDHVVALKGMKYGKIGYGHSYFEDRFIDSHNIGYFKITEFKSNKFVSDRFEKFVERLQKAGCNDIVIDLRGNPGGSGDNLDDFFSVISNKDSLFLSESRFVKVSDVSKGDYEFLASLEDGELARLPDSLSIESFKLKEDRYIPNVNYYLLIDKGTSSTASAFANIFQYNELGLIAGEALLTNALTYGDIYVKRIYNGRLVISTIKYNEYTKASNGIFSPDIILPYVAKEYMNGDDPVLQRLLDKITQTKTY